MGTKTFYAHGKLLLTGEYLVLDGAKSLAIPTRYGQRMVVSENFNFLHWVSYNSDGEIWFEAKINSNFEIINSSNQEVCNTLISLFKCALIQNPEFKHTLFESKVETHLEFDRNWGLGSSSTLIHLLGEWSNTNPYSLLGSTFGGSGYDLACARANGPITYQISQGVRDIEEISFNPGFSKYLFFVYLGKKQVSKKEIAKYSSLQFNRSQSAKKISYLTEKMLECNTLSDFQEIISEHENILSDILNVSPVQESRFADIEGSFKSLGAWGGDFVLFAGETEELEKISAKGYDTILSWNEMINQ